MKKVPLHSNAILQCDLNWWSYNGRFTLPPLDYVGKLNVFTTVLIRGRQRFREERRYLAVAFEDEGRSHEPGKVGNLQNLEKARKQKVPKASNSNASLPIHGYIHIYFEKYLLIYFWWHWIFTASHGLSPVVGSGGCLRCGKRASPCGGFSCCGL